MAGVLLVDDDPAILRSYQHLLAEDRAFDEVELLVATTPEAAFRRVEEAFVPLVVSDYNLGSARTGLDVLAHAALRQPQGRRVLLTGEDPARLALVVDGRVVHAIIEKGDAPPAFLQRMRTELALALEGAGGEASRLLCLGCRHAFHASGARATACPKCGSAAIRALDGTQTSRMPEGGADQPGSA